MVGKELTQISTPSYCIHIDFGLGTKYIHLKYNYCFIVSFCVCYVNLQEQLSSSSLEFLNLMLDSQIVILTVFLAIRVQLKGKGIYIYLQAKSREGKENTLATCVCIVAGGIRITCMKLYEI